MSPRYLPNMICSNIVAKMHERVTMGFFDDYDILGGLSDLVTAPFKAADKVLFGPPGEVGGLLGTPINAALENPVEALTTVATVVTVGTIITGNPVVAGIAVAATGLGSATAASAATAGSVQLAAKVVPGLLHSPYVKPASDALVSALIQDSAISQRQALAYLSTGFVLSGVTSHVIDNYVRETIEPVRGSVVYCDLACTVEHSGIYVGHNRIVHLDGNGAVELVSRSEFLGRLGGLNPAMSIYVSSAGTNAVGSAQVASRALAMVGGQRKYNVLLDNCHQFTSGCLTGNFENADNFWWAVKATAERELGAESWRVWNSAA